MYKEIRRKIMAGTLAAGLCLQAIPVNAAGIYVYPGFQGSVTQGSVVYFDAADKRGPNSDVRSLIEKAETAAKEKVENENSAMKTNMAEQYDIYQSVISKAPADIANNGSAMTYKNTLSNEEYKELARQLGWDENQFDDYVNQAKPNMAIIDTVKDIVQTSGDASDLLKNPDGSLKDHNSFFPDDYNEKAFRDLLDRLGVTPEEWLKMGHKERIDAIAAAAKEIADWFLELKKMHTGYSKYTGDYIYMKEPNWWDKLDIFYRNELPEYHCSRCGHTYGFGKECACNPPLSLNTEPMEHMYNSPGLGNDDANAQYGKCQYCKTRVTSANIESFYWQAQDYKDAGDLNIGTFALVCGDCASRPKGVIIYDLSVDDGIGDLGYASGHGDAFSAIEMMTTEEFEAMLVYGEENASHYWYCKVNENTGEKSFPNLEAGGYTIAENAAPVDILGELKPYIQINNAGSVNNQRVHDFIDQASQNMKDGINEAAKSFDTMWNLLMEYADNNALAAASIDPSQWEMEGVNETIEKSITNMIDDIEDYQKKVIDQNEENNALSRIRDSGADGVPQWDERMKMIFGDWPGSYDMWTDNQKELYKKFMEQYQNGGQEIIDQAIKEGIFNQDKAEDIKQLLDTLDRFADGYTDILDSIILTTLVDSSAAVNEETIKVVESLYPDKYQVYIGNVGKGDIPWTSLVYVPCSSMGSYVIKRWVKPTRTKFVIERQTVHISWVAEKKGQGSTPVYERDMTFSSYYTQNENTPGEIKQLQDISFMVVAGDQIDMSNTSGHTTQREW